MGGRCTEIEKTDDLFHQRRPVRHTRGAGDDFLRLAGGYCGPLHRPAQPVETFVSGDQKTKGTQTTEIGRPQRGGKNQRQFVGCRSRTRQSVAGASSEQ